MTLIIVLRQLAIEPVEVDLVEHLLLFVVGVCLHLGEQRGNLILTCHGLIVVAWNLDAFQLQGWAQAEGIHFVTSRTDVEQLGEVFHIIANGCLVGDDVILGIGFPLNAGNVAVEHNHLYLRVIDVGCSAVDRLRVVHHFAEHIFRLNVVVLIEGRPGELINAYVLRVPTITPT